MRCQSLTIGLYAGFAVMLAAPVLTAQAVTPPPIRAPIQSARRAAAATNAHLKQEQHPEPPTPGQTAQRDRADVAATPVTKDAKAKRDAKPSAAAPGGARRTASTQLFAPVPERGDSAGALLTRETFTYAGDGRRDPFVSLMTSGELRPMISDLKLVAVIYDPAGHSVAILRDLSTNEQYRVTVGKTLGRMRVAQIQPKSVTFTLEEFGYSRQEVLALNDSTTERAQ